MLLLSAICIAAAAPTVPRHNPNPWQKVEDEKGVRIWTRAVPAWLVNSAATGTIAKLFDCIHQRAKNPKWKLQ